MRLLEFRLEINFVQEKISWRWLSVSNTSHWTYCRKKPSHHLFNNVSYITWITSRILRQQRTCRAAMQVIYKRRAITKITSIKYIMSTWVLVETCVKNVWRMKRTVAGNVEGVNVVKMLISHLLWNSYFVMIYQKTLGMGYI